MRLLATCVALLLAAVASAQQPQQPSCESRLLVANAALAQQMELTVQAVDQHAKLSAELQRVKAELDALKKAADAPKEEPKP